MEKTIQINLQKALQLYASASGEFKVLLENEFGKDALTQKITDRIKTFEDACKHLGLSNEIFSPGDTKDEIAYKKLKVIAKALNEGWQPDWTDGSQYKYYPWFDFSSGSGLAYRDFGINDSGSTVGSRLCYKSRVLAIYAGKQFTDIYADFMTL